MAPKDTETRQGTSSGIETKTKPVGIWIRVSTEDQAQGESPEHHEVRARHYAQAKGWNVVRVYDLSAVSGKTVMEHPEAISMMTDVREGRIEALIFSKLARLARNTKELLELAEFFREEEADLVSLAESIDTSSPAGRFFYTLIAAMAQWEREEIADRVKAAVAVRAKLGKPLGGAAPYGYQWNDGALVLDSDEAPIRRELFEIFATERRIKTTARLLNQKGYRTRAGKDWTGTTVRRLIQDPIAKGKRRVNSTQSSGDGKHWVRKPEEEWIWIDVPRIVSDELWAECNAVLDAHKRARKKPAKKAVFLFSGVCFCTCGGTMYVPSKSKKYVCVDCKHKIPIDTLELIFQTKLTDFLSSPEDVARALAQSDQALRQKRELLATLKRECAKATRDMDRLYQLYMDDGISKSGFGQRYRPLEERQGQLRDELPSMEAEIDVLSIRHLSSAELVTQAQSLYQNWGDLPFKDRRAIVEAVVSRIEVSKDEVQINLVADTTTAPIKDGSPDGSPSSSTSQGNVIKREHNLRDATPRTGRTWQEKKVWLPIFCDSCCFRFGEEAVVGSGPFGTVPIRIALS